jgi:hypothetical protein
MSRLKSGAIVLQVCLVFTAFAVDAEPYRAMVTRTAETTKAGGLEVGLRYQGFVLGAGRPTSFSSSPWHQVAAHARFGILDNLELDTQVEALVNFVPGATTGNAYFGDIPIGLQWTLAEGPRGAVGLFGRLTLPTGPGGIDILPPTLSDGTLDVEGTFIAEWRPTQNFRLMGNLGLVHHGTRDRGGRASFDVPEAVKYGVAATFNLSSRLLLTVEGVGHYFFSPQITPVWDNNQHLMEVIPGLRFEPVPRLVLEAALGISVSRELQEIHRFRPLLGLTYEFSL